MKAFRVWLLSSSNQGVNTDVFWAVACVAAVVCSHRGRVHVMWWVARCHPCALMRNIRGAGVWRGSNTATSPQTTTNDSITGLSSDGRKTKTHFIRVRTHKWLVKKKKQTLKRKRKWAGITKADQSFVWDSAVECIPRLQIRILPNESYLVKKRRRYY